jgi:hypothetical protein
MYITNDQLLIDRACHVIDDQLATKRREFQQIDFNPQKLWHIANEIEALSWVLRRLSKRSREHKRHSYNSLDLIVNLLRNELVRTEKYLDKPSKDEDDFSESDRLKSKATIIEWSLFQIHFIVTGRCK